MFLGDGFLSIYKTRAIVIKNQDYRENDRIIWLFTEELGKISVIAQGARKTKNRFMTITLPFCYGEYIVFKGKNMYTLNEGAIEESFQSLLDDLSSLTYGTYLNELTEISTLDEEPNRELFKDLIVCFYLLKNKVGDFDLLVRAFELKLLKNVGYGLNFDNCCCCGKKVNSSNLISFPYYGVICCECSHENSSVKVSFSAINILRYLLKIPLENVCRLNVSDEVKEELENIMNIYITQSFSRKPNSIEFIKLLRSDKNE